MQQSSFAQLVLGRRRDCILSSLVVMQMRWRVGRATGGEGHRCSRCWTGSRPSPGGSTSQGAGWWVIAQQQRAFEAAGEAGVLRVTRRYCRSWRVEWAAEQEEKEEEVVVEREEEVVVVEMMQ